MRWHQLPKVLQYLISGAIASLTLYTLAKYNGNGLIYLLFTLVSNALLYAGFRRNAMFFDAFIGVFLWLGFWLKLSLRIAFMGGVFNEAVGSFDGSGQAFDQALLIATCGLSGLLLASCVRAKWVFNYPETADQGPLDGLFLFYRNHRMALLSIFVVLFVAIGVSNVYFGIYQKGSITRTVLPFGLNGIYKWLLLFGMASFSALILKFEFEINKRNYWAIAVLALCECFVSNVSQLSRGMILNAGSLLYGALTNMRLHAFRLSIKSFFAVLTAFFVLFSSSVMAVNYIRSSAYWDRDIGSRIARANSMTTPLFIDRWVGIEGVLAVSNFPHLGWEFWKTAWKETYNENDTSFYDKNLTDSAYVTTDKTKHHFISLPGSVAFFFYPGSFLFLFWSMFALGGIAALLEISVYKLGGRNVILCSLLAQVIAYRYANFGYVPRQSYLLFGTIYLNLLIIYFANLYCSIRYSGAGRR